MTAYRVENRFLPGMPRTPRDARPFRLIAAHDTEGAAGYQGAIDTLAWMVSTAAERNASYHELWAWDPGRDEFTVIRSVPPGYASHSVAPQPTDPASGLPLYQPDAWVRAALGDGWQDPNFWIYAVSVAGTKAQVDAWAGDPRFVAACRRRLLELRGELGVTRIAEHARFNPRTRSDWGTRLTPALGGLEISEEAPEMAIVWKPVEEDWLTGVGDVQATSKNGPPGGQFWTGTPGSTERKFFTDAEQVHSIAESADGEWRLLVYGAETLVMHRNNLRAIPGTRRPATGYGYVLIDSGGTTEAVAKQREAAAAQAVAAAAATEAARFAA